MARCPLELGNLHYCNYDNIPLTIRTEAEYLDPPSMCGINRIMVANDLYMHTMARPEHLKGSEFEPYTPWLVQEPVYNIQVKINPSFEHRSVPGHIPAFLFNGHERIFYTHPQGQMIDKHRPTGLTVPYVREYRVAPPSLAPKDPSAGQMYNAPVRPLAKVMLFSLHGSAIDPTTVQESTFIRHSELLMQHVPREDGVRDPLYYTPDMAKTYMIGNGRLHCKSRDLACHDMNTVTMCPPGKPAAVRVSFNHFDAAVMLRMILDTQEQPCGRSTHEHVHTVAH
jgi:hypothetical protein